jgi:transposase
MVYYPQRFSFILQTNINTMKKYIVRLAEAEREYLRSVTRKGNHRARAIIRARILLLASHDKTDQDIAEKLDVSKGMVRAMRKRYCQRKKIQAAIHDAPRPGKPGKMTPAAEAFIVATACTKPPHGHDHWFLEDLKEAVNETYDLALKTPKAVREALIRNKLKPWREKNVVHPKAHAAV